MKLGVKYLRDGIRQAMQGFRLKPVLKVWQWIDQNVVVPLIVGSPFPGLMDTGRTPPLRGLFDLYWQPRVHMFTLCKSARVGGTVFALCCVLHKIATWPGPILWVDPTRKTGGRFSRAEMQPFLQECKPVAEKMYTDRERCTTLEMMFRDCTLGIVGTGSAAELGGRQAELLILNERDKFRHVIDKEAPPAQLAIVRTKQFRHTRKILENSTPTDEGADTWQNFLLGTQHYCYVPCPHCQKKQRLSFFKDEKEVRFDEDLKPLPAGETRVEKTGRFFFEHCKDAEGKYDLDQVERSTQYECGYCEAKIDHTELNWMLRRHEWISHNPRAFQSGHISAHFWAAYSLFEHWGQVAKNFLLARGSVGKMQDFYNSDLGLPFVRRATDIKESDIDIVIKRSPAYLMGQLPARPEILTMTVDVQGFGFWWSIRAWGIAWDMPELPTWSAMIDCGAAVSWDQIEEFAGIKPGDKGHVNRYSFDGKDYQVTAGLVDSGFESQQNKKVYEFTVRNRHVFSPSKGSHAGIMRGKVVTTTPVQDDQVDLVMYQDDTFKQQLYYHNIKERQGLWWAPIDAPDDWRKQLTAERTREVKQKNGSTKLEWEIVGQAGNHLGDCEKMHLVLADTIETRLDEIREEHYKQIEKAS